MENTFWNNSTDVDFVDWFKVSFALYVESGTRKKMEAAIDILGNKYLVAGDFKEEFYKIIIEHHLCRIYCFYSHLTYLMPTFSPS